MEFSFNWSKFSVLNIIDCQFLPISRNLNSKPETFSCRGTLLIWETEFYTREK